MLSELNNIFQNGAAKFGCFTIDADPFLNTHISRNWFGAIHFFEHLLASNAFVTAFGDVQPYKTPEVALDWEWSSSYVLGGDLASVLMLGGAYKNFKGSSEEAMELGRQFTFDLFGNRYEDVGVFKCYQAWSSWFHNIAWDTTWMGVDKKDLTAWIIFCTDAD